MNAKKNSKIGNVYLDEPKEFIEKISNKLRKLREETNYSQEAFAYEHGFDRRQWYNMENGVDMKLSTLYRALTALDISPAEFFKDFK